MSTHHSGGNVGLAVEHGALLAKKLAELRVDLGRLVAPRDKADGGVITLDIKVVLERDREAVEGTSGLASLGKGVVDLLGVGDSLLEENLGETVGL